MAKNMPISIEMAHLSVVRKQGLNENFLTLRKTSWKAVKGRRDTKIKVS